MDLFKDTNKKFRKFEEENCRLKNIIQNIPGCIYWKNTKGIYAGCNQMFVEMAGLTSVDEVVGKSDSELCWKKQAPMLRAHDIEVITKDESITLEEEVVLANGDRFTYTVVKAPLKDKKGNIIGVIGTSLDITYRKEYELQLAAAKEAAESASQAKAEFIRNMEHQMRTPFSGVYILVQSLYESETDLEKKELLKLTFESAKEFLELLNNIIDFSRNQLNGDTVLMKKYDLKAILNHAVIMEKATAVSKKLSLTYTYPEDIPSIFIGDPYRIERLVLNLLSNAIKFTNVGNVDLKIKLAKHVDEKHLILQIIVADTGIGIAEEKQRYIFEKFYRLSPANHNKYKGAGLGLYIVKQITDELEGEIDVESRPNKGTTITCTIPFQRPLVDEIIAKD